MTAGQTPHEGPAHPRDVRLCFLGFGNVARAFCTLLAAQAHVLGSRHGLRVVITAAGTRHGSLLAPGGLAPAAVLATIGDGPPPQAARPAGELLAASAANVLVELTEMGDLSRLATGTRRRGGGPAPVPAATGHILDAFRLGMDVVTANKAPIAWSWSQISAAAAAAGRRIRFESTVMDGLPVFSLLEFALPDCALLGVEAVFNGTTNFIIDALGSGRTLDDALGEMQAAGLAEADPANDLDGWDAASKAAALANVVMGADITPLDVERVSLRDVAAERIAEARGRGRRVRLVTSIRRDPAPAPVGGPVHAGMRAEELDIDHPLAAVGGDSLGALLHTDLMADVLVCERRAYVPQTAYGVYADLLHLCRTS